MAHVHFPDNCLSYTQGVRQVRVAAASYRELLIALEKKYPGIHEKLDRASVAIDGQIYQDAFLEPVGPASEVHFLPRIEGG
jgi:hypothetical protein